MMQKYKVFTEKGGIFFNNSDRFDQKLDEIMTFEELPRANELCSETFKSKKIGVICKDITAAFDLFKSRFDHIYAAGGWVCKNNDLLWIKRNGFWDLPKGKVEKNESIQEAAVREVEEECGVEGVELLSTNAFETFHIYHNPYTQLPTIKTTFWYPMSYLGTDDFTPQIEEGIEEVRWIDKNDELPLLNTFPSILELWHFMEQ